MADRAAPLAGDLRRSHRSRIAGAGDGLILRGGARTGLRRVVRSVGGGRRPRSHAGWPARRRPVLAGRLPDQCAARPRRPMADATLRRRRAGRRPERKPGFARHGAHGIGAIATTLLPWWMLRASDPLVPPALFRSRNFTVTNLSTLVIYAALAVTFYYLT